METASRILKKAGRQLELEERLKSTVIISRAQGFLCGITRQALN